MRRELALRFSPFGNDKSSAFNGLGVVRIRREMSALKTVNSK